MQRHTSIIHNYYPRERGQDPLPPCPPSALALAGPVDAVQLPVETVKALLIPRPALRPHTALRRPPLSRAQLYHEIVTARTSETGEQRIVDRFTGPPEDPAQV